MNLQRLAVAYLIIQGSTALIWWIVLLMVPASRPLFRIASASDNTLWALSLPDFLLYIGLAWGCAYGFHRKLGWAWPLLCVHGGAVAYATLYTWTLPFLGGEIWGALLMTPSLLAVTWLCWKLRPGL